MAERGQQTAEPDGLDLDARIDEQLVEQALAGAWYRDGTATAEAQAAARDAQRALVRGMMAGLGPRDMAERIWAQQTTTAHLAATDAFKWLAKPELPDSARVLALRLAAQLMTVTGRQLAGLDLHRARLRADAEARARAAERARRDAETAAERDAAAKDAAARPKAGGVVVVPRREPPEVEAERRAEAFRARRRAETAWRAGQGPKPPTGPDPHDPSAAAAAEARAEGRGPCLLVPEELSPEDWNRAARIYQRALQEPDP
jgi:hypothetical protein